MSDNAAALKFKKLKRKPLSENETITSAAAGLESSVTGLKIPTFGATNELIDSSDDPCDDL